MLWKELTKKFQLLEFYQKKELFLEQRERNQANSWMTVSKSNILVKEMGKMYKIDDHILTSMSGLVGDANYLIDSA